MQLFKAIRLAFRIQQHYRKSPNGLETRQKNFWALYQQSFTIVFRDFLIPELEVCCSQVWAVSFLTPCGHSIRRFRKQCDFSEKKRGWHTCPAPLPSHNTTQHLLAWSQPWSADFDVEQGLTNPCKEIEKKTYITQWPKQNFAGQSKLSQLPHSTPVYLGSFPPYLARVNTALVFRHFLADVRLSHTSPTDIISCPGPDICLN